MIMSGPLLPDRQIELWAGIECTVNRVGDRYVDQLELAGHAEREADLDLLSWLGVVTPRFLWRQFRWAVVIIFTVAAIVTPTPDIVNQCVFALPGVALYLLGVGAAYLVHRDKKARAA